MSMAIQPFVAPSSKCRFDSTSFTVFSTCPQSREADPNQYLQDVARVARWSDEIGCSGILIYTDNGLVDPWLVSQTVLRNTRQLCPLIAVQPIYVHPYMVAKKVASLGFLHGRRVCLNMLAGGFKNDLIALGDDTPHDDRYVRTTEYTWIIKQLLESDTGVTFNGKYYNIENLKLTPRLPDELQPGIFLSGSSPAGMAAAVELGATAVKYPHPSGEETSVGPDDAQQCIRVGIVAREDSDEAWGVAHERFPEDRKGQMMHQLAMKMSDSHWHRQLSAKAESCEEESPYWLHPFQNYKTFCPYLVGSYERVAMEIASYTRLGHRTFILDIPPSEEELSHIGIVFNRAQELVSND